MKKGRRITAFLITAAMLCTLMGCGGKQEASTQEETTQEASEEPVTTEEDTEEAEENQIELNVNLIQNGDFSNGVDGFFSYCNGGAVEFDVNESGEMQCDISKIGTVEHGVQIYYDGFTMQQGVEYEISFDVHGTIERDFDWRIQLNGGDYHAYATNTVTVNEEVQHITETFTMQEASDPAPRLCFNMGYVDSMEEAGIASDSVAEHSVMFDNLSLMAINADGAVSDSGGVEVPKVKVNQLGYGRKDKKIAVFADLEDGDTAFTVVEADTDKVVFEGELTEPVQNDNAGEMNCTGDFSELTEAGTYKVVSSKGEESYPFTIDDDIYDDAFANVVKMFYLQRCGQELPADYAGEFNHPQCHNTEAVIYGTDKKLEVSGGWHDAGDYGRYVVAGAKAAADLMLAYEKNPQAFSDDMGIPESGNGVSDLLDEVRYELSWMLKMQNAENGGVYHKVTCAVFPETVMPQEETDELIVSPISNTATGDFAAVMAMASRIYQDVDKDFANQCIGAAEQAWRYLEDHKSDQGFKNPGDVVTGEYPDENCTDEILWAAAELCKATDDVIYLEAVKEAYNGMTNLGSLGWADVAGYGVYAVLTSEALLLDSSNFAQQLKEAFLKEADNVLSVAEHNPYMVQKEGTYEWGSNMGIANSGMLLCLANEIKSEDKYIESAKNHLNYIFGVNATGYCFVTGEGSLSPESPHHRPSQALNKVMAGMLIGGPDSDLEDPYAKAVLADAPAAKCYVDNVQSYSCNEVTIYWNSPLVYLMAAVEE
ncbi:MAG: glycoside hydrolase family 9 protein [Clostridium sp.]|nr:glycoside hydrolase family 9 protein [Clostridium sp.]